MSAPTASANGAASASNNISSVSGVLEGVKTELKNKEFVQHRVDNVIKTAHDLRSRLEGSSSVLKYGFQAFDKSTSWVTTPLSNKLSQIAPPVLQGIDNGLATAYTTLDDKVIQPTAKLQENESVQRLQKSATEIRQQLVSSQWFQYVDTLLHKSTASAASAASGSSSAASAAASANFAQFYALASESFVSVRQKAGDYSAFLNDLKGKMASTWDERIQGPARLFYTNALEKLRQSSNGSPASPSPPPAENIDGEVPSKSTTARFEEIFSGIRRSVAEVWAENFITTNAKALYNASLQHYLSSEPHTSPRAYVNGMKERIGKEWHDRLALPLEEFFRNARQYAVEDLQKVKTFLHLEVEDPKDVTVGELVAVPGTVVQEVRGLIHRSWDYGLSLSQSSVDYILPEVRQQQEEEKSEEAREGKSAAQESKPSLYSLSGRVAQRLKQRAAYRWQQLRQLSSTRVKNVLHVDPLSVAEQKVQDTQEKLVRPAWTSLHHSFSHVASSSQDQLARLHAASKQQLTRLTSSTAPYTSFLFSRVHSTIEFAQNSAQTPLRYVSEAVKKRSQPVLRTLSYDVDRLRTEALDLASFSARQVKAQRVLSLPYASAVFAAQLLGLSQRDEHSKQFLSQVRSVFSAAVGVVTLSPIPASAPNSPAGAPAAEQPAVSPAPSPAPSPSQEEHISNSVPSSPAPAKANGVKPHADAAEEASPSSSPQPLATPPIPDARSVSKPVDKEVEVKPAVESKKAEAPKAVEEEVPETEVEESSKDESAPEESTANPEKKQTATSAASKSKKRNNKKNQAK